MTYNVYTSNQLSVFHCIIKTNHAGIKFIDINKLMLHFVICTKKNAIIVFNTCMLHRIQKHSQNMLRLNYLTQINYTL